MAEKKIWIMAEHGIKIPGSVLGCEKDYQADAFEPVKVPEGYGRHLIADRFAVETDAPVKKAEAPAKKAVDDKALESATQAVKDAEAEVEKAGSDDAQKAVAEAALANAKAALAKLQGN